MSSLASGGRRRLLTAVIVTAVVMMSFPVVAAIGDSLLLGNPNRADAVTSLSGSAPTNLRITNTAARSPALDLRVVAGSPPLKVNSNVRVMLLNADLLDGKHSNQFALAVHLHDDRYLRSTATAANADLLDGLHGSAFALAVHNHDLAYAALAHNHTGVYLPVAGKASDADMLDGQDSTAFAVAVHQHDSAYVSRVGSPAVGNFPTLNSDGELANSSFGPGSFSLAAHNHDPAYAALAHLHTGVYLPVAGKASDADRLDGQDSTAFAMATHLHDSAYVSVVGSPTAGNFPTLTAGGELANSSYGPGSFLTVSGTAANSNLLQGNPASTFMLRVGTPTTGNFPTLTSSGNLLNSSYGPGSFLTVGGTAANSNLLGGLASSAFALVAHNHDSAYVSVVGSPTAGNFPTLSSSGELQNSVYNPGSFLTVGGTAANSSLLDGIDSNQLVRANGNYSSDLPDNNGIATAIPIQVAAGGGYLVISGSLYAYNSAASADTFQCSLTVGGVVQPGSVRNVTVAPGESQDCGSDAAFFVGGGGTYTVGLNVAALDATTQLGAGSVSVIWVRFAG